MDQPKLSDAIAKHSKEHLPQSEASRPAILIAHDVPLTRELIAQTIRVLLLEEEAEPKDYADVKVDFLTVPSTLDGARDIDGSSRLIAFNKKRIALALMHERTQSGFRNVDDMVRELPKETARVLLHENATPFKTRGPQSEHDLGKTLDSQLRIADVFDYVNLRGQVDKMSADDLGDTWKRGDCFTLNDETIGDDRVLNRISSIVMQAEQLDDGAYYTPANLNAAQAMHDKIQLGRRGKYHQAFYRAANRIAEQHGEQIRTALLDALKIRSELIQNGSAKPVAAFKGVGYLSAADRELWLMSRLFGPSN